jgi:fluoride ion exporter CrcB/FEX
MSTEGTAPMNQSPELAALNLADKPDGPGAAMMISAGFGVFVLGFLTVLAEASAGANTWLATWQWGQGVGALAGKSTVSSLLYFASLAVLWVLWRDKVVDLKKAFYVGLVLGVLGVIGTFPTFFQMFAA